VNREQHHNNFQLVHHLSIAFIWIQGSVQFTFTKNFQTPNHVIKHWQIIVSGKVVNTGFRLYAMWGASSNNIRGEVKYSADQVIIDAEGEENDLINYTEWCRKGPVYCEIDSVDTSEKPLSGYYDFKIL
jgi:acylphosphatase